MTVRLTALCLILYIVLVILSNGCLAPPILFPKTGASGIVIDQTGQPLKDVRVEVVWYAGRLIHWYEPSFTERVSVNSDGSWDFYRRKVDRMYVDAYAPPGYEPWKIGVDIYARHRATNVVFQFHKVLVDQPPKESK